MRKIGVPDEKADETYLEIVAYDMTHPELDNIPDSPNK